MKKFLKSTLAVFLMIGMMLGLTACGGTPLTKENVVGTYRVTYIVATPKEGDTSTASAELSRAEFEAIVARKDAGTATTQDNDNYARYAGEFEIEYKVTEDGNIYQVDGIYHPNTDEREDLLLGTWEIKNGSLVYDCIIDKIDEFSAEWKNGKIEITEIVKDGTSIATYGVVKYVITLEKVA